MASIVWGSFNYYVKTLTQILGRPRHFFQNMPNDNSIIKPFGFLLTSGILYSVFVSVSHPAMEPAKRFFIDLTHALGMCLLATLISYIILALIFELQVRFYRLFNIIALCSGVTLLASWIPIFDWLTEPWKWWLVCLGIVHGCKLKWYKTLVAVGIALASITLYFLLVMPISFPEYR